MMQIGCISRLVDPPLAKTPIDIYDYEVANYPASAWWYAGTDGDWHYFKKNAEGADWKIRKALLPELEGYRYHFKGKKSFLISADLEIHQDFIRIHIDDHPPYRIPFQSRGFLTAEHRQRGEPWVPRHPKPNRVQAYISKDGKIKVEEDGREVFPEAKP